MKAADHAASSHPRGRRWRIYIPLAILLALVAAGGLSCNLLDGLVAYVQLGAALRMPAEVPPAVLEIHGRIPVVHVYGTPREMGTQYGTILRTPLLCLHRCLHAFLGEPAKERILNYAREHEKYLPAEVREELTALCEASGMPYIELVAMNLVPRMMCSTLAVWGDARWAGPGAADPNLGGLLMGRNADYFSMGFSDRGMVMVVYHPARGRAVATVNFLGMIGAFSGVNENGVSFGNMLVFNAGGPSHDDEGLTVQLAMRLAAQQAPSAAAMADLMLHQRHAIPMNVMIADGDEALVLELGLTASAVRRGKDGVLASTNYFRTPELAGGPCSCSRYDSLLADANAHRGRWTVKDMQAALDRARIPGLNMQAVVFEPAAMRVHVSTNHMPASEGPYETFDLKELFSRPPLPVAPATQPAGRKMSLASKIAG